MSAKALLSGCALFVLGIASAAAGPCTTEIQNLSMIMGTSDAGSGPTGRSSASEHPPTTAMKQADPSTRASSAAAESDKAQHPPTATMNQATTGMSPSNESKSMDSKQQDQHPPTAAMNQATGGSAASPADVQRQTQGAPTASGQAQGSAGAGGGDKMAAMTALDQARALDREGKEAECMAAIRQAQQHMAR